MKKSQTPPHWPTYRIWPTLFLLLHGALSMALGLTDESSKSIARANSQAGTPFVAAPDPDANNILYVNINVNTAAPGYTGNGDSWANAIPQLAEALRWARTQEATGSHGWSNSNPLKIFVAKGIYKPSYHMNDQLYNTNGGRLNAFVMVPDVELYGGFDPVNNIVDLDDARIMPTISAPTQGTNLSGDFLQNDHANDFDGHVENAHHIVIAAGILGKGKLDGFMIGGASWADASTNFGSVNGNMIGHELGGGLYISNSTPAVNNCLFFRNSMNLGAGMVIMGSSTPVISKCTFYKNGGGSGAGAVVWQANPTFSECAFIENTASESGGGLHNMEANPSLVQCIFKRNKADAGGAISNSISSSTFSQCEFTDNTARNGGGMMNGGGSYSIIDCQFTNNAASADGGGIHSINANTTLSGCTFTENTGSSRGGAMRNDRTTVLIKNSRFLKNTSIQGGAIINESCPSVKIMNSLFYGNVAEQAGAMLSGLCETVKLTNCTIFGNTANQLVGGLVNMQSTLSLTNTIIWGNATNTVTTTPEVSLYNMGQPLPVITNSLIANWGGSSNWDGTRGTDGGDNIDVDPLFTSTVATNINFLRLANNSPSRNTGNNTGYTADGGSLSNDKDLAGNPRSFGSAIDMGAYENQYMDIVYRTRYVDDVNGNDSGDGTTWSTAYKTLAYALTTANGNPDIESILVAKGTYYPTGTQLATNRNATFAILRGNIKVIGGYNASDGTRNLVTNKTILSGAIGNASLATDDSYHIMVIAGIPAEADSIVVDGFTIRDSYANGTGNTTVNGQSIEQNYGGGIHIKGAALGQKLRLNNLTIQRNFSNYAGGIFNDIGSSPLLTNCLITGNLALYNGGGVLNKNGASPILINCTIAGNKAASGGGIYNNINASPQIRNTIVFGNSSGITSAGGSNPVITYSMVQEFSGGTGNLDGSPHQHFQNPKDPSLAPNATGDYQLQACSPAINRGDNTLLLPAQTQDIQGDSRAVHTIVDLGAYEYQNTLHTGLSSMAQNDDERTLNVTGPTDFLGNNEGCRLIASIVPAGTPKFAGTLTAKVGIDAAVTYYNGSPYVQRHYEINSSATGSADVTLYFTQSEFSSFNAALTTGLLPTGPNDNVNKGNIRVYQFHGTGGDTPSDFPNSAPTTIDPQDNDVRWNDVQQRWEITFRVDGFSGFFIGSVDRPLPVRLISFTSKMKNESFVSLQWQVTEQVKIDHYTIQYSVNGKNFQDVGTVNASTTTEDNYRFDHHSSFTKSVIYYRLRITEADGTIDYSRIISIHVKNPTVAFIYPNPVETGFQISGEKLMGSSAELLNAQGIILKKFNFTSDQQYLDIHTLPSGIYLIKFPNGTTLKVTKK